MSATITMNQSIENAVKEMCCDAVMQAVETLSEEYGFNNDEAVEILKLNDMKFTHKRVSTKSKKGSKKSDKPKVKKSKSGYLLHNDAERINIKAKLEKECEESGEKLKSTDIITALGGHWKALSDDDKKIWNDKAALLKESDSDKSCDEDEN